MELTQTQIKEGNEKLAKLMGWYLRDEKEGSWFQDVDLATYVVYSEHNNHPHKGLPFHRDWNYLMKVIDKLGNFVFRLEDWKSHYSYSELFQQLFAIYIRTGHPGNLDVFLMNNIESVWLACVTYWDHWNTPEHQEFLNKYK